LLNPGALSSALNAVIAPMVKAGRCSAKASSTTWGSKR
jgi:hypothetical protein